MFGLQFLKLLKNYSEEMKTCHVVEEAARCLMQRLNQFPGEGGRGLLCGPDHGSGHCQARPSSVSREQLVSSMVNLDS